MNTQARITMYGEGEPAGGLIGAFVGGNSRVKTVEVRVDSDGDIAETANAAADAARTAAFGERVSKAALGPIMVTAPGEQIDGIKVIDPTDQTRGVVFIPDEISTGEHNIAQQLADAMTTFPSHSETPIDGVTYDEGTLDRVREALSEIGYAGQAGNNIVNHLNNRGILLRERA